MAHEDEYLKFIDSHIAKLNKLQTLLNSNLSNYSEKLLEVNVMLKSAEYFKTQYMKKTAPVQEPTLDFTDYCTRWVKNSD